MELATFHESRQMYGIKVLIHGSVDINNSIIKTNLNVGGSRVHLDYKKKI